MSETQKTKNLNVNDLLGTNSEITVTPIENAEDREARLKKEMHWHYYQICAVYALSIIFLSACIGGVLLGFGFIGSLGQDAQKILLSVSVGLLSFVTATLRDRITK